MIANRTGERSGHKRCIIIGCDRPSRAKGRCGMHYKRKFNIKNRIPLAGDSLTPSEDRCLQLIDAGFSNKQIAMRLDISYKTVLKHMEMAYKKLGAHNRMDAWVEWRKRRVAALPLYRNVDLEVVKPQCLS